jgi:hypothetical protein
MFKVGQKVICISEGEWEIIETKEDSSGPSFKEIVTIIKFDEDGYLQFAEYPNGSSYPPSDFRPLINISKKVLASLPKEIVETSDVPTLIPAI